MLFQNNVAVLDVDVKPERQWRSSSGCFTFHMWDVLQDTWKFSWHKLVAMHKLMTAERFYFMFRTRSKIRSLKSDQNSSRIVEILMTCGKTDRCLTVSQDRGSFGQMRFPHRRENSCFHHLRQVIQVLKQQSSPGPSHYHHHVWHVRWNAELVLCLM